MSEAIVEKRRGISPVWILPLLAICLGGWLLFKSYRDAGIDITLLVNDSSGIVVDKTAVVYKGNTVGIVKEIHGTDDLQGVILTIEMNKNAEPHLVEDLKFWVEKVDVEAGRITGLDTLLSGNYIGVQLGTSTKPARSFVALSRRPPVPENAPGLHLTLQTEELNSLEIGSGIYHRDILIGSVQEYTLQEDDIVSIDIYIQPEYQNRVKKESRFWNASGITLSGGISDLKIHVASLASIIKGGIMMQTPETLKDSLPAENGQTFILYDDFEKAEYGIPMTLVLPTGEGIKKDSTSIMYRGLEVGLIKELTINRDEEGHSVTAHILLDPRAESILREGTVFYMVKPEFSYKGIRNLDRILTGTYITFVPGNGAFQDHFQVRPENPPQVKKKGDPGDLEFLLTRTDLGSINIGSPILYKKIPVGEITDFTLREKEDDVLLTGLIRKKYAGLLKTTSRFYNLSGVEVTAGLSGVKIQTGNLETIVDGGVSFFTPVKGKNAENGRTFKVFDDLETAENNDRIKITIHFDRTDGLKKGTKVKYHGIEIGMVSSVFYENNMETITVEAMLEEDTATLLKDETQFWMVRPEFSLTGTQHLDTILGGPYIAIAPGEGGLRVEFDALPDAPAAVDKQAGLSIVLEADDLFSLKRGNHVYYRKVVVGEITGYELSTTFQKVLINVLIYEPFIPVVRENTKFWNASGIHVRGGVLSGLSVSTESLEGLLAGGIALATPEIDQMGEAVTDGHHFTLFGEAKEAWQKWSPEIVPEKGEEK